MASESIQLFARDGTLVGTVSVTLQGNQWPDAIRTNDGRLFTLQGGRYVESVETKAETFQPPKES